MRVADYRLDLKTKNVDRKMGQKVLLTIKNLLLCLAHNNLTGDDTLPKGNLIAEFLRNQKVNVKDLNKGQNW
jgi:hypothetical protein